MKYTLLIYENEADFSARTDDGRQAAYWGAYRPTRAKAKIRDAGIRFEIPEPRELSSRLDVARAAIYAAYGSGWEDVAGADPRRKGLAEEAMWLGRLVVRLLPGERRGGRGARCLRSRAIVINSSSEAMPCSFIMERTIIAPCRRS